MTTEHQFEVGEKVKGRNFAASFTVVERLPGDTFYLVKAYNGRLHCLHRFDLAKKTRSTH
jgi:hypothetical protein